MYLISVVIPSYNHSKYLVKLLNSIKDDNYKNVEIIIIDDGSSDNSVEIIENWINIYKDQIKIFFKKRANLGVSKTLNELINFANGEFIAIIASDDFLIRGGLKKRVNALLKNPQYDAVFGDCIVVNDIDNIIYESGLRDFKKVDTNKYKSDILLRKEIITNWAIPGGSLMVRKKIFKKINFATDLCVEDRDFYLKMVSQNLLMYIDEKVSAYRIHNYNTCLDSQKKFLMAHNSTISLFRNMHLFKMSERILFLKPLLRNTILLFLRYFKNNNK